MDLGSGLSTQYIDKEKRILTEIGFNYSLMYRINKEVSNMYGLRGSFSGTTEKQPSSTTCYPRL